jgi:putative FmdB family regulatory protein
MAIYEFKCTSCGLLQEIIMPMNSATFENRTCTKCKSKTAKHVFAGAPNVATSGMSTAPIDVVVGRDAEARWADIKKRQEIRNKARAESGAECLRMTGRNRFEGIRGARKIVVEAPDTRLQQVADKLKPTATNVEGKG